MYYVTVKQSPIYHQITLEEFLGLVSRSNSNLINENESNTRTYKVEKINEKLVLSCDVDRLISILRDFNVMTTELRVADRHSLYDTFHIPKKSGGLRKIDAPNDDLMNALRLLKKIFEEDFMALYHTSAFAYIRKRSTIHAVKRHQNNESKWFGKFDLSNFFGNTTMEFVMQQLSMIYPFCLVMEKEDGRAQLEKALELAFLDGGLPQGTPISPLITNVIMIPIDHELSRWMRERNFVYTRYADDFLISNRHDFRITEVQDEIIDVLRKFNAPFSLNTSKTRYGSSAGSNWNLGVMLNKDNKITVGAQKKRQFRAMLCNYIRDHKGGIEWALEDLQVLEGYRNYYRMVEEETIDEMVKNIGNKFSVDVVVAIKEDIRKHVVG